MLTQHIWQSLQVWTGPFSDFFGWGLGRGYHERVCIDHVLIPTFCHTPFTTSPTLLGGSKFQFRYSNPVPTQHYLLNLVDKDSAVNGWEQLKDPKLAMLKAVCCLLHQMYLGNHPSNYPSAGPVPWLGPTSQRMLLSQLTWVMNQA